MLKINGKYIKQPKNDFTNYLINLHNYLVHCNDGCNVIDKIDKITGRRILRRLTDNKAQIDSMMFTAPYFWKEVFTNINNYLQSRGQPPLVENNIDVTNVALDKRATLKYKDVCIDFIIKLRDQLTIYYSKQAIINKNDIMLIDKYLKQNGKIEDFFY